MPQIFIIFLCIMESTCELLMVCFDHYLIGFTSGSTSYNVITINPVMIGVMLHAFL